MGKKSPLLLPPVPEPCNQVSKTYDIGEFIEIVTKYPKGGKKRGGMISQIMEAGYVKRHQCTLREVLRSHAVDGRKYLFDKD